MDYERMYFHLMGAMATALDTLERGQIGPAQQTLIDAQLWGEECYVSAEDHGN